MRVVILGCGYVGLELGRQLTSRGHDAIGVRRSRDGLATIEEAGFDAVAADVTDPDALGAIPDADVLVYTASSGGRGVANARDVYVDGLRTVVEAFGDRSDPPDRLVYTSSTGVYGDHSGGWVDEATDVSRETERQRVLVAAERVARSVASRHGIDGTVARLAGIYGPGRHRVDRYLDGPVGEGWLNLIHRADAAGAIGFFIEEECARDETVIVVDDEPVAKHEFADWLAAECGVDPPPKQTLAERLRQVPASRRGRLAAQKRCSNAKLQRLGYEYAYPTYREGYGEILSARDRCGTA